MTQAKLHQLGITCSPARDIFEAPFLSFRPYGSSTATNVLEHFLGTPEVITNVLFLGSGDLRNALLTASKINEAYHELEVHVSDHSDFIVARNLLITFIIVSDDFDPSLLRNINYLWDLWYSFQWGEVTRKRFAKDVKKLLIQNWNHPSIFLPDSKSFDHLKSILKDWLDKACSTTPREIQSISVGRILSMKGIANIEETAIPVWKHVPLAENASLSETVDVIKRRMCIKTFYGNVEQSSIDQEIKNFIKIGNCVPITGNIVCFNPTIVTTDIKIVRVPYYLDCPFDAYFPVPVNDQLASDNGFVTTSPYTYCKSKLQSIVSEFHSRRHRVRFHFYFGDCLELCLGEKLRNKCEVVHCSDLADRVGLANLILTASNCLSEIPESILVTDTANWCSLICRQELPYQGAVDIETIAEYLKISLRCPLSMIPTLYGLRLTNHVNLGSPFCVQLHDFHSTSRITLKWVRAPAYSNNVKLEVSHTILTAIQELSRCCFFIRADGCHPLDAPNLPYSPLTFYFFLWSLVNRLELPKEKVDSIFNQQLSILPTYQLEWKTQQAWMKGEQVVLYSALKVPNFRDEILEETFLSMVFMILVSNKDMVKYRAVKGKKMPPEFFTNVHCIENFCWGSSKTSFKFSPNDRFKDPSKLSLCFMLEKDHRLDTSTHLCFVELVTMKLLYSIENIFNPRRFTSEIVVNPTPLLGYQIESRILNCTESEDQYNFQFLLQKNVKNLKDVTINTEQQHPSWSAHQITLTTPQSTLLSFQVSWPFLVKDIEIACCSNGKKRKNVTLTLKKSLHDPWPVEFGGRSKWDVDRLKHWKNLASNGDINMHIEAQFNCNSLKLDKRISAKSSFTPMLDQVREIVRALFYSHVHNSFYLFAIYVKDKLMFHLRVQPPVRFTPQGSPLLLVSVIDHKLEQQLIVEGKLDAEENQFDFHRLITERVSREVCAIQASCTEEVDLFRYSLRLNSTRMRRGVWTSKNLPRGENSPWMPTFVSPLYVESVKNDCNNLEEFSSSFDGCGAVHEQHSDPRDTLSPKCSCSSFLCHNCGVKKITLKKCTRCMTVFYCSIACQKKKWEGHRRFCNVVQAMMTKRYGSNYTEEDMTDYCMKLYGL